MKVIAVMGLLENTFQRPILFVLLILMGLLAGVCACTHSAIQHKEPEKCMFYRSPLEQTEMGAFHWDEAEEDRADGVTPDSSMEMLAEILELTEDQRNPVFLVLEQKNKEVKRIVEENLGKGDLGNERCKEELKARDLETTEQLEKLLTDTQFEKYQKFNRLDNKLFWQEMKGSGRLAKKRSGRGMGMRPGAGGGGRKMGGGKRRKGRQPRGMSR